MIVIVSLSVGPFSRRALPDLVLTPKVDVQAATTLSELSQVMITMSVGLFVAAGWVYNQPLKPNLRILKVLVFCVAALFCLTSIYAGLRFRYELGQQFRYVGFDFGLIGNRMTWQGSALLGQVSMLCLAAAMDFFYGDDHAGRRGG